jgi:hypothetical protein
MVPGILTGRVSSVSDIARHPEPQEPLLDTRLDPVIQYSLPNSRTLEVKRHQGISTPYSSTSAD